MNGTVLSLLSALAVYWLIALALPQPFSERLRDPSDLAADVDEASDPASNDDDSQLG
jgi:hypothetical protein